MPAAIVERPAESFEVIGDLLDIRQMAKLFGVTELSITNWRTLRGLPYVRISGTKQDAIRFRRDVVLEWAKREGQRTFLLSR